MTVLFEKESAGTDTRCRVERHCTKRHFWEADIQDDDQFLQFIADIARAWSDAQFDRQGLHLHINQVSIGDI